MSLDYKNDGVNAFNENTIKSKNVEIIQRTMAEREKQEREESILKSKKRARALRIGILEGSIIAFTAFFAIAAIPIATTFLPIAIGGVTALAIGATVGAAAGAVIGGAVIGAMWLGSKIKSIFSFNKNEQKEGMLEGLAVESDQLIIDNPKLIDSMMQKKENSLDSEFKLIDDHEDEFTKIDVYNNENDKQANGEISSLNIESGDGKSSLSKAFINKNENNKGINGKSNQENQENLKQRIDGKQSITVAK